MADSARKHSRAAFTREDVEDSKRGNPGVELRDYAAARQLEFIGSGLASGFRSVSPIWPDYVFNLMRGVMPSGHFGLLENELYEVGASTESLDMNGTFHSV